MKNSHKEIYFNKVSDLYQQLTSLGSIFQWTTFFTHYSEHLSMNSSDYLCYFCDFCLSFAKILWSQKQNMQTIFTETPGEEISLVQRFSRDLLSNHKEDRKSAELLSSSTIFILWLCFYGIFNFNQKTKSCRNANNFWR